MKTLYEVLGKPSIAGTVEILSFDSKTNTTTIVDRSNMQQWRIVDKSTDLVRAVESINGTPACASLFWNTDYPWVGTLYKEVENSKFVVNDNLTLIARGGKWNVV